MTSFVLLALSLLAAWASAQSATPSPVIRIFLPGPASTPAAGNLATSTSASAIYQGSIISAAPNATTLLLQCSGSCTPDVEATITFGAASAIIHASEDHVFIVNGNGSATTTTGFL